MRVKLFVFLLCGMFISVLIKNKSCFGCQIVMTNTCPYMTFLLSLRKAQKWLLIDINAGIQR